MRGFIVCASLVALAGASIISSPKKIRKIEPWSDQRLIPKALNDALPPCDSKVYCNGTLLHTVQMASIFKDSKTFVDMKLKQNESVTLDRFNDFMKTVQDKPSQDELRKWVEDNFEPVGSELENWTPTDFKENITLYGKVKDETFKKWASDLNNLWKELGRKIKPEVAANPGLYSIIPVPNPFIVAGGRFLEQYYWDSYWIIRGLIQCEMHTTVKGMLGNFLHLVSTLGQIPNGARRYYEGRSQPPLLAGMMKSYLDATGDKTFIKDNLGTLREEYDYFHSVHSVLVGDYMLYRYVETTSGPRPEAYREDFELAANLGTNVEKENLYSELKAGAESGMDYTSRWFISANGSNHGTRKELKTRSIVAVDLNAIMYWNARIIAEFYSLENKTAQARQWNQKAETILAGINELLWSDEDGSWFDYDILNNRPRKYFSVSNLSPLWLKAFPAANETYITEKVLGYINKTELDKYAGGVPNTEENTGEQWDFPNVWAPMQYMLIMGLDNLQNQTAKDLAYKWADKWVQNNWFAYDEHKAMFEKYHAVNPGDVGGGGEYEIQKGFGWTNGVILDLLSKYGDKLTVKEAPPKPAPTTNAPETSTPGSGNQVYVHMASVFVAFIAFMLVFL